MATYTHTANYPVSGLPWFDVEINGDTPLLTSATLIVLANADGTETRISGTGFTFSGGEPTGGTATGVTRTSSDAAGDSCSFVENLRGSAFNGTLVGNAGRSL